MGQGIELFWLDFDLVRANQILLLGKSLNLRFGVSFCSSYLGQALFFGSGDTS